jgi:hypothetical protein
LHLLKEEVAYGSIPTPPVGTTPIAATPGSNA